MPPAREHSTQTEMTQTTACTPPAWALWLANQSTDRGRETLELLSTWHTYIASGDAGQAQFDGHRRGHHCTPACSLVNIFGQIWVCPVNGQYHSCQATSCMYSITTSEGIIICRLTGVVLDTELVYGMNHDYADWTTKDASFRKADNPLYLQWLAAHQRDQLNGLPLAESHARTPDRNRAPSSIATDHQRRTLMVMTKHTTVTLPASREPSQRERPLARHDRGIGRKNKRGASAAARAATRRHKLDQLIGGLYLQRSKSIHALPCVKALLAQLQPLPGDHLAYLHAGSLSNAHNIQRLLRNCRTVCNDIFARGYQSLCETGRIAPSRLCVAQDDVGRFVCCMVLRVWVFAKMHSNAAVVPSHVNTRFLMLATGTLVVMLRYLCLGLVIQGQELLQPCPPFPLLLPNVQARRFSCSKPKDATTASSWLGGVFFDLMASIEGKAALYKGVIHPLRSMATALATTFLSVAYAGDSPPINQ